MRILAVDPGEKRIGIALSDPTGTIASPLTVILHVSRLIDAGVISDLAREHTAELIIVGQALDSDGYPTPQANRAARLADVIRQQSTLPVVLWDESGSTNSARQARIAMGVNRKKRHGHLDDIAATVILQNYLDHQNDQEIHRHFPE
jgi:putative holliday junction resolvase